MCRRSREIGVVCEGRHEAMVSCTNLLAARGYARTRGLPLAYFYAETQVMAEAIVTFWLLNQADQRKVLADLKKRVFAEPKKPDKG